MTTDGYAWVCLTGLLVGRCLRKHAHAFMVILAAVSFVLTVMLERSRVQYTVTSSRLEKQPPQPPLKRDPNPRYKGNATTSTTATPPSSTTETSEDSIATDENGSSVGEVLPRDFMTVEKVTRDHSKHLRRDNESFARLRASGIKDFNDNAHRPSW